MSLKTETTESHMKRWKKIFFACMFVFVLATGYHTMQKNEINQKTEKSIEKMNLDNIKHGIVFFTFDDRNFNGWLQAIPLFEKSGPPAEPVVCTAPGRRNYWLPDTGSE